MQNEALGPATARVGFIGLGIMGGAMAGHLARAGYRLHVYNRTRAKAEALLALGATWHDDVSSVARASDVVFTIVGFPKDVEEVYLSEAGLLASAAPGSYLVDMTTSAPALAERIAAAGRARGLRCLDAPVTGGDVGAKRAELTIMVGGEEADCRALVPLFECMGRPIHQGPAGFGQHAKLANQVAIAGTILGVAEALGYARCAGLDPERVVKTLSGGAAGSTLLANVGPRMLNGDYAPGFYVKHFLKDLHLALDSARTFGLETRALELAQRVFGELSERGHENEGTQAVFRLYGG